MAKKRLNKKVALIGSAVFVILGVVVILAVLYFSRDPEKFIKAGDVALKAAREATDEQIKEEHYKTAERNYHKARSFAKSDSLKVKMLFKLVDIYTEIDQWRNVLGCWNRIIQIDSKNVKARFGKLKYFYIMADSGMRVWQEVASQASEFIEIAEDADLLAEDTAQWEPIKMREGTVVSNQMGPYLYLLRGRANLRIAGLGAVTDPNELLTRAINDLENAQELEPDNVDAYWYLAQAIVTKGRILALRGDFDGRDKAVKLAKELLEQGIEVAGADPRAHVNLLLMKRGIMLDQGSSREQMQSLEPEYLSLVQKFPSSARAHSALAGLYLLLGPKNLDKAVEAVEKAVELDKLNVTYARAAADLYYRKFSIYGQEPQLYKAIEVAKNALTLPDAQDKPGPRSWANRMNRISLYAFLADCYIERVLGYPRDGIKTEAQKQKWLTDAEQAVHEVEQLSGSGEEPLVIKWRGMLELAKGNRNNAIKKLYAAYEQLKAASARKEFERVDSLLSYRLAKVFEDTELGAASEFFAIALRIPNRSALDKIDERKPEALLDFADVLLKLRGYSSVLSAVSFFENEYWPNERSQALRINAYIGAKQWKEAEEELAKGEPDDPNTIELNLALVQAKIEQVQRAIAQKRREEGSPIILQGLLGQQKTESEELKTVELMTADLWRYRRAFAGLVNKLLQIEPNSVGEDSVTFVCNGYMSEKKFKQAEAIVNGFLEYFPDSAGALFYKQILSEPKPGRMSLQRRKEIEEQILSNIADPIRRAVNLGVFYRRNNELEKAAGEFKNALGSRLRGGDEGNPAEVRTEEMTNLQRLAASHLFDLALEMKDWELAEQVADLARRENLDDCEGNFFAARLAVAKEEYKDALARLNESLKHRPIFSHAFMLRSNVNAALGNEYASIEDAQKAASLNPLDGDIAKSLAIALCRRNLKLGDNVSSNQVIEAKTALDTAIAMNPRDLQLLSLYAEYISPTEPLRALAIRQRLQKAYPTVENALLLGQMAMRVALDKADEKQKETFFGIAASSLEQARDMEPQNKLVLNSYAEYYRLTGQPEKAKELLTQSQSKRLLWRHYLRSGKFVDAKEVLERLYQSEPKDSNTVRGLLLVAERTADREAVEKYSEELLSLEDSINNYLFQIQTFLKLGLVKEAEYKLQSFKEKHPDEPRAMLLEAWLAMRQGQLERALELTNRSLETDQDNAVAWRLRGEINRLMANYDQAIIDLKRSKFLSDEPDTRIALAKAYLWVGRGEDAITELEIAMDNPQTTIEARTLLEQIYLRLGRREAIKRFYEQTLEELPDSVLWYNRAAAFAINQGELDEAEQLYSQAWQKSTKGGRGNVASLDGYLKALLLGGKLDKVFEEGRKYVDSGFAPTAYLRMAEAKVKLGDKVSALQYCRKAVDKAGTKEGLISNILRRMYSLLGAQEVLQFCKERLETDPDSFAANRTMFSLMRINGEYNKAVGYLDKCLQIMGPDNPRRVDYIVQKATVLSLAYNKFSDNDYLKRAVVEYESLLAEMPNNISVLNNLAYMLAENGERLTKALEYAEQVLKKQPNNPGVLDTYAYVLYKNGRFREAAEYLQAALQQYESQRARVPAEVYEHLGMIKEGLGTRVEAIAAYKQALETGADTLSKTANERIKSAVDRLSRQD